MTEQLEQINAEIEAMMQRGEFGTPPDPRRISETWKELTSQLVESLSEGKPVYNSITGLWYEGDRGKVAYTGRTKDEITIPANTKILVFRQDKLNDRQPDLSAVFVTYA